MFNQHIPTDNIHSYLRVSSVGNYTGQKIFLSPS